MLVEMLVIVAGVMEHQYCDPREPAKALES